MTPSVTVGVPVYRGELHLSEALDSIQRQTFGNLTVLMSIDGDDPACEAICGHYAADPRFRMHVQPQRLGWVGNINWLMSRVETDFWYFHQQDDITHPTYVERLLSAAERRPAAAVVYSDLLPMGRVSGRFDQPPSVVGSSPFWRQMTLLREHFPAFAFRGLVRKQALREAGDIPTNDVANFGVDITWLAATARWGELWHVGEELYWKRYHDANTESSWWALPRDQRLVPWGTHCTDMLEQALKLDLTVAEARLLFLAAVERLWSKCAGYFLPADELNTAEKSLLLATFLRCCDERRLADELELSHEEASQLARSFVLQHSQAPGRIVDFGPKVLVGEKSRADGSTDIWVRFSCRPDPRCRLRVAGRELDTVVAGKVATARVPGSLLTRDRSISVALVHPNSTPASDTVSISAVPADDHL